jgi:hypothetical protein
MNKSRKMRWTGYVAQTEKIRSSYKIFFGRPEGKMKM